MGISGFFYYLKNTYPKSFTNKSSKKYDYLVLDYHSLFHNIKNLYDEINYTIRLLFEARYQYENNIDYFFDIDKPSMKSDNSLILSYVIKTYKNFFKLIGIDEKNIRFTAGNLKDTLKKINIILNKFPVSEEIIKKSIIADIVEHTEKLAKQYTSSVANTVIYFDGIPSVSKMKEQLSRRIGLNIFKMLNNNIITTAGIRSEEHEIRGKLVTLFPPIDLNSPLVNETRHILTEKGFTINDKSRYGEAEHQMMKDLNEEKYKNKNILIASPDADLILLSMIAFVSNNVKIDIYRESILSPSHFDFSWKYEKKLAKGSAPIIISPYMREIFFINVGNIITEMGLSTKQKILDISYLFLLLGDDFIPIVPTLNVQALTSIIQLYNKLKLNIIADATQPAIAINSTNLIIFLKNLSLEETKLKENKKKKFDLKIKEKIKNVTESYKEYLIFMNSDDNIIIRKLYYLENGIVINKDNKMELLMTKYQEPEEVDNSIIKNYLEGYQFIFDLYYKNNISNYKWYYPYEKAPTLAEIVKYLDKKTPSELAHIFDYTRGIITATDLNYFDLTTYKKYIDDNKNKILKDIISNIQKCKGLPVSDISLSHANLEKFITYDNIKCIYKCFNALFIQGCVNYDRTMINPNLPEYNVIVLPSLLGGSDKYYLKYMKYKNKFLNLRKQIKEFNIIQ